MDLRLLEYFLTVSEEENITRAAERLHVTQPTLSRQLMDLEDALGTSLLIRGKRRVTLTDAGILFRQRAEEIVSLLEKTRRDLAEQDDSVGGTVAIGCGETCASRMLPKVLKEFSSRHERVKYDLYSADGDCLREKLDRGDLDFCVLLEPVEVAKYDYLTLPYWETWGLLMRADDPLSERDGISVEDVKSLPLILPYREILQDTVAEWLGVERRHLNVFASHNLISNITLLVDEGLGYAMCVQGCFEIRKTDNLCFVPIVPERKTGHVMAWKKNRVFHSAAGKFLEFMRERKDSLAGDAREGC